MGKKAKIKTSIDLKNLLVNRCKLKFREMQMISCQTYEHIILIMTYITLWKIYFMNPLEFISQGFFWLIIQNLHLHCIKA